ncbi:MAG: GerMN domain-containing protein [Clostridiales bacterium]
MKKYFKSILVIIVILIAAIALVACQPADSNAPSDSSESSQRNPILEQKDTTTATVYYATTDNKWLVPLTLSINATREVAKVAMEKLLAGPPSTDFAAPVIPEGTKLRDIYTISSIIYVDLTKEIQNIAPENAQIAIDAIVATVLPLAEDGHTLQILIDGKVADKLGEINISQPIAPKDINYQGENQATAKITVYFGDNNAMYLVPLTYDIDKTEKPDPVYYSQKAIEKLLEGPSSDSGLMPTLWKGTKLLSLELIGQTINVNLDKEALDYGGGSAAEQMFVNSLIYSLTSIEGISDIQILIEGKKIEYLPEGTDVSQPLKATQLINSII